LKKSILKGVPYTKEEQRQYYLRNLKQRKAYFKQYRFKKLAEIKAYERQYRLDNREKIKVYYVENREKYKERRTAWRKRVQIDPVLKFRERLRRNMQTKFKRFLKGCKKSVGTMKLYGCDLAWLTAWLEVQFKPGMTWQNYGSIWHLDHVRPCVSFDLSDPQQQKLCFHWTNLQPLFAEENLIKGDKWEALRTTT
jgi:hypothetical protein